LTDENQEFFQEKVKFWKFLLESENFSKIGGNLKLASWSQGGWTPLQSGTDRINGTDKMILILIQLIPFSFDNKDAIK